MKESDLSEPVCRWLQQRGLVAYCEVPAQGCCIDVVGLGTIGLVAVELKVSLSRGVLKQARLCQNFAVEAWCAVPTKPRSMKTARLRGLGILRVRGDTVSVLLAAKPNAHKPFAASTAEVERRLSLMAPGGTGGIQSPINDGPAQETARLVAPLYQAGIAWREIFATVPSHYANPNSMRSAMLGYGPARVITKGGA